MRTTRAVTRVALTALAVALAIPVAGGGTAGAAQGSGNPTLAVSNATLFSDRPNTITVTGTDYLVPPHAPGTNVFGGVYLFFGWVRPGGSWGPSWKSSTSNDGSFGYTYHYAGDGGDASTRDDGSGTMRLISFTAGGESGNATDFHMDDAGNWSTTLTVRGSKYQYKDPQSGRAVTVDCQAVQCGVYTIGAHGKASRTNEKFVPVSFVGSPPATPLPGQPVPSGPPAEQPVAATPTTPQDTAATSTTTPTTVAPAAPEAVEELPETGERDAKEKATDDGKEVALSPTSSSSDAGRSSAGMWIVGVVVVAGAGGGATYWYVRRRSRAAT